MINQFIVQFKIETRIPQGVINFSHTIVVEVIDFIVVRTIFHEKQFTSKIPFNILTTQHILTPNIKSCIQKHHMVSLDRNELKCQNMFLKGLKIV